MTETKSKTSVVKQKNKIPTEKPNKRHTPFFNYVNKWLLENNSSQKIINSWEKDEPKFNKFMKAQERKIQIKKFKDPNAPKKPSSAYMVYCNQNRAKIKEKNSNIEVTEIMKELGAGWKALTEKQRIPYQKEAENLKAVYLKEMETYVPPEGFPNKKINENKPKKPLTNYIIFCQEKRCVVVKENQGIKATEVLSKLGEMWGNLSEKQKEPYNKKALKAKAEYLKVMENYNKKNGIEEKKPVQKKKKIEEEELSDSEE
jgi:hypothetical protein